VLVGVLGGTGPAGGALALRLAAVGHRVVVGSRSPERAREVVAGLLEPWGGRDLALEGAGNEEAAGAELVVVATPWDAAAPTTASLAPALDGKVLVCMANALTRIGGELVALVPPRGSIAASVQAAVPAARVAAAFHHVPAHELGDLDHPVECDVLVCADDPQAMKAAAELIDPVPGLRAIEAGSLSQAAAVEAFTAVLIAVNRRYKTRTSIRLLGIPEAGS
jgi:8-hydroxy-5-deazaflavin:NADPH oxidoreductase